MRVSLVGMAGSGKSYWSLKLAEQGLRRFCCDELIAAKLARALKRPEGHPEESVVVDTTGSVIYVGQELLRRLGRHITIVYLSTPAELQGQLFQAYITNPHPMAWREVFRKEPDETNEQALAWCYIRLVSARDRVYEQYAHVTIDYYTRSAEGFGVSESLSATTVREA